MMTLPFLLGSFVAAFAASFALTGIARRYALRRRLLDIPDHRSSHTVPTPRGGGIAIVVVVLVATAAAGLVGLAPWRVAVGLLGGGALVALVGFIDDHGHVPASRRLIGHVLAATWVVAWMGGVPPALVPGGTLLPDVIAPAVAIVYLVWLINLTNFMDGTDGIAAVEILTACLGAILVYRLAGAEGLGALPGVLAAAALGFLVWNRPPARIFMGDVGSGFAGLFLGSLSLHAGAADPALFWSWVILLGAFIVDATTTLIRRILRGEAFYRAHRSHAYQHAARRWRSHGRVALGTAAINVVWLLPLAALVGVGRIPGIPGVLLAYVPLLALVLHFDAGAPADEGRPAAPRTG